MNLKTNTIATLLVFVFLSSPPIGAEAEEITGQELTELVVEAKIPRGGDFLGFGFESVWMMTGDRLVRVNPADNSFVEIPVEGAGGIYRGIAFGEQAVWVPDTESQMIFKIDPSNNSVAMSIPAALFDSEGSIGIGAGAVWAVTSEGAGVTSKEYNRRLSRFNAANGALEAVIDLPSRGASVIYDFGSVWITGYSGNALYRLDPNNNEIIATVSVNDRPRFLASGGGAIWVLTQGDGSVQRVDPATNSVTATIATNAEGVGDIDVGGGSVWIATLTTPLYRIDPGTNRLLGGYRAPSGETGMRDAVRWGAGSIWVSGTAIFRIVPPS